ncbi:hypothetical protein OAK87_01070 [bacterium]|nr:hypothetical protein [bacterium]
MKETSFSPLSPIPDAPLAFIFSIVILKDDPMQTFLNALGEAAGASTQMEIVLSIRLAREDLLAGLP